MPANDERGEVTLTLEGVDYILRPTYEAILAVENLTGQSLIALATAAQDGSMKLGTAAAVAAEFIRAWGKADTTAPGGTDKVNATRIGQLAMAEKGGAFVMIRSLVIVLLNAATGGYTAAGEVQRVTPAVKTPEAPPADS